MSCERGRMVQREFEEAVATRIRMEHSSQPLRPDELRAAKSRESNALLNRTVHVSGCQECEQT